MQNIRKIAYIVLIVLIAFLALTAIGGGIGILAGFGTPIVDLEHAIFKDLTIPGLALMVVVGGGALAADILLIRRSRFAVLAATAAGIIIMFFEFVEVMVIGSPTGPAQAMQIIYYGLGTVITIVTLGIWFIDLREPAAL